MTPSAGGFLAECIELDAAGEGATRDEAVRQLRESILDRMRSTEAIAPPSKAPSVVIELSEAAPHRDVSPQGPGEA